MNDLIKLLQRCPETPPLSRRTFFSAGALALASTLMVGRTASRAQTCKRIEIPELSAEECLSQMKHYTQKGWEAPLPIVLGVLIGPRVVLSGASLEEGLNLRMSFLSVHRVRRILRYAATPGADCRVLGALQEELDKTGWYWGNSGPFWIAYSGWLKRRILECFDQANLPLDRTKMLVSERVRLEDLLRLPLRTME
jgi:hypothetical protein